MNDTIEDASDKLASDTRLLDTAARQVMDSVTGDWSYQGRPFIPEIIASAQTIIEATGRLAHALEKAALEIGSRASDCYIDRLGSGVDASEQIREVAEDLLTVAQDLRDFPQRAYPKTRRLSSIGERE